MSVHLLKDVPREALVGKFICGNSLLVEQEYGYPGVIVSLTKTRLTYSRLARGAWDQVEKEWCVLPRLPEGDEDYAENKVCTMAKIKYVCDTAEEAIALYWNATKTRKAIAQFRSEALSKLEAQASSGELEVPPYLKEASQASSELR